MINLTFSQSFNAGCYGNRFLARIGENCHATPSFCVLAFHNGWEDRNTDARVNNVDEPSTFIKHSVNFGLVILQALLRQADTCWALPCI